MGTEKAYIVLWRELTEQFLGWENSAGWGEYEFDMLSDIVFEKTATRLSVSTLRRIWEKVRYDSTPTKVTLNALARFLDFNDWRAFKQKMDELKALTIQPEPKTYKKRKHFKSVVFSAGALIILYLLISWNKTHVTESSVNYAGVKFQYRIISDNMPNSVVFNYDASGYHSNQVFIQQSWDPKRREKVDGIGNQHTSLYYYPGFFNAKLLVDGQIKKSIGVFIKTKGWVGIIDKDPIPTYLNKDSINIRDGLGITSTTFSRLKGSDVLNNSWVHFYNFRNFKDVDGFNFHLDVILKNTSLREQSACRKVSVAIIGTENGISIPLADKGCISELNLDAGDQTISGIDHDLSAFGCDFKTFQHLSCRIENKQLVISLNNKLIYSVPMKANIGKIVGLRIGFEGSGVVSEINLGNEKNSVYHEIFQKQG